MRAGLTGLPLQAPLRLLWKPSWEVGAGVPRRRGECGSQSPRLGKAHGTIIPVTRTCLASGSLAKEARGTYCGSVIDNHGLQTPRYA